MHDDFQSLKSPAAAWIFGALSIALGAFNLIAGLALWGRVLETHETFLLGREAILEPYGAKMGVAMLLFFACAGVKMGNIAWERCTGRTGVGLNAAVLLACAGAFFVG